MEAMKMENELRAPGGGHRVKAVHAAVGQAVRAVPVPSVRSTIV